MADAINLGKVYFKAIQIILKRKYLNLLIVYGLIILKVEIIITYLKIIAKIFAIVFVKF